MHSLVIIDRVLALELNFKRVRRANYAEYAHARTTCRSWLRRDRIRYVIAPAFFFLRLRESSENPTILSRMDRIVYIGG